MGFGSDKTGFYKPSAVTVTATGNPLTLQNAKRLRKLTIYGNAVQDGTPSPDAPVEVQLCGDRTGNLFDITQIRGNQIEVADNKIYLSDYACSTLMSPKTFLEMTGLNPGDTITCSNSAEVISGTANDVLGRVAFSAKNGGTPLVLCSNNTRTVTIPSDFNNDNYNNLLLYGAHIPDESGEQLAVMSNLAIYKGSYTADTLPAYEPYGYKVSGRTEGLNLFTSDESDWQTQTYKYFKIPIDGTTTLQMKLKSGKSIPFGLYIGYTNTGHPSDTGINWLISNGAYVKGGVNIMSNSKGYISMYPPSRFDEMLDAFDIMLVQGSYTAETMPPYEPYQPPQDFAVYLPEQIAKVGDVADEVVVDFEKQTAELRKNVGSVVADGEENWFRGGNQYDTADYTNRYSNFYDIRGNSETPGYFSNRFERKLGGMWNNPNSEAFNINNNQLHLTISNTRLGITADDEASDRTTKFKAWLNDNNVTVYAPLATPVTTDITSLQQWDAMPQVSGTVTLTLSAEVEPSGAEAVYTVTKRPKAQAHGADAVR